MATAAEVLAAADRAEAAGDAPAAERLRAYAKTLQPAAPQYDPAQLQAAAERARAAGDNAAAARLMAAIPAPAPTSQPGMMGRSIDPASLATQPENMPAAPPAALAGEAGHKSATDFAGFEMFNPELAGRFTPETMPQPGEVVLGTGPGRQAAATQVTVRDWRQSRQPQEQFGDTAAAMVAGPLSAAKSFAGGLTGGPSPSRDFLANDPLTRGLPGPVLTGLGAVGDVGGAALSTLGAGLSGAVGLATEAVPTKDRLGLGEELLGMSQFAVPELAGASSIPARVASAAPKVTAPAVKAVKEATPTIEGLRTAKSAAYKAVDDAGETFTPAEMTGLRDRIETELADGNYVEGVDRQTDAVRSIVDRKAGAEMSLGQLDKLRQEFYKRLAAAPNEVGIHDAIDASDVRLQRRIAHFGATLHLWCRGDGIVGLLDDMGHHVAHATIDQRLIVELRIDLGLDHFLDAQCCVLVLDVFPLQAASSAVALVVGQFLAGIGGGSTIFANLRPRAINRTLNRINLALIHLAARYGLAALQDQFTFGD